MAVVLFEGVSQFQGEGEGPLSAAVRSPHLWPPPLGAPDGLLRVGVDFGSPPKG